MKILTVSELTSAIKAIVEPPFRNLCVKGEISNFKLQSSGHLYFSLKDSGSQIGAVLFRGNAAQLVRMPKEGDQVIAKGEISIYAPNGRYQIIIRELQFLGVGELLLRFHHLKEQLQAKGWFDQSKKKALPKLPKRIAVVTSPTGAVIQDILHILTRRFSGLHVLLHPVKVQGDGSAQEIAQAINELNQYKLADVIIVGRGGGSIEDLWAFNEELVAKAIFESEIPIISAVGHETDYTIADWVADIRAPTPSAAAEIVVAEKAGLFKFLLATRRLMHQRMQQLTLQGRNRLNTLSIHPLLKTPYGLLAQKMQQLDAMRTHLEMKQPSRQIEEWKQRLSTLPNKFSKSSQCVIQKKRIECHRLWEHLQSLNPQNLLKKGYSILFSSNTSSVILSVKDLTCGTPFTALLHDGRIEAFVKTGEI